MEKVCAEKTIFDVVCDLEPAARRVQWEDLGKRGSGRTECRAVAADRCKVCLRARAVQALWRRIPPHKPILRRPTCPPLREPKIWWINGLGFQNSFFCFGTVRRTNTYRGSFTKSVLEQLRKPNCFTQAKRSEKPTVLERFLGFFVLEQFGQPTRRRTALQKSGLEQLVYSLVYSFQCSQTVF